MSEKKLNATAATHADQSHARRTKIIATLGPATNSPEMIEQLIAAGMNVARINMSHADADGARILVGQIRAAATKLGHPVGIMMDLQGPAIRTGDVAHSLNLKPGERIALTVRGEKSVTVHGPEGMSEGEG